MDGDRKYKQNGYQESDRGDSFRSDRPKQQGPRPSLDITGPKLPRLVQNVVASRCYSCAMALPTDTNFKGNCPKCGTALHCCKQCAHFEPSTRFQCLKPIPERIPIKDAANECTMFSPRVTVARDGQASTNGSHGVRLDSTAPVAPRNATDARAAFNNLFKK
jgi:hypothetical protein